MTHNIEDMTDNDLLEILLSPFTPADYKVAALTERTKRKNAHDEVRTNKTPIRSLRFYPHLR